MFKTLGAKRYMYKIDNKINMVASGVNPKMAMSYLKSKYKTDEEIFNAFDDELIIPSDYSGRKIHTYIDTTRSGKLIDYLGNEGEYFELSSVHLESCDYNFSLASEFIRFIEGIQGGLFDIWINITLWIIF